MKKFTILSSLLFLSIYIYSQNYLIDFKGTGSSTSVGTVKVENLTQGTNLTINGTDILNLKGDATGLNTVYENSEKTFQVYPNPISEYATIEFFAAAPGNALIAVYDQVGKTIIQTVADLVKGTYTYQINGLSSGFYTVRVTSGTYSYAGKIVSQQKGTATISIAPKSFSDEGKNEVKLKSTNATVQMQYNNGDRLKFTGISGNYSTVLTDIPTVSKTITFDFIACTDGDNNNYPVVKIGAQTWMAENLKVWKSSPLHNAIGWGTLTEPAFCWYNNDGDYEATYGVLYNWYAVNTVNLCPTDWHVPTDAEWTTLTNILGGEDMAGGKLKETGTAHWTSPNTGAANETGFTALPGSYRHSDGSFNSFPIDGLGGYWWSTTGYDADNSWYRKIINNGSNVSRSFDSVKSGFSVRCLMSLPTITDIEGNVYHTVTIGTQKWTVENLKTTKYNDGTDIPHGTPETWPTLTTPAYCWYNDSADVYKETYGALYNWYAVDTASNGNKNICPAGWHVPVNDEWTALTTYLGGEDVAGGKLKETGTVHWIDNMYATNEFGFTALPAGARWNYEDFCCLGYSGYWWSTTPYDADNGWYREIDASSAYIYINGYDKYKGMSVRCVMN
jgi:uncharacterized protein (TIGR02145 family)